MVTKIKANDFLSLDKDALLFREGILFIGLTLLYLLPIWVFQFFPSQDGPSHIYNATLIRDLVNPQYNIFQEYYRFNTNPDPTWFTHLLLTSLMYIFDPITAEKVFLSFYVVMFVGSVRYALGVINADARWIVFMAFPLVYNYILYMGFYACSISFAMSFIVIGYWLRHSDQWHIKNLVIFSFLGLLLYLFHIVSFAMTCGILGVFTLFSIYDDYRRGAKYIIKFRIYYPLLTLIPTLVAVVFFLQSKELNYLPGSNIISRIKELVKFPFIVSFQLYEIYGLALLYTLPMALFFVLLIIRRCKKRKFQRSDSLLVGSIACGVVFLVAPEISLMSPNGMSGGNFILARISAFPVFLIILWFASQWVSASEKKFALRVFIAVSILVLIINLQKTAELNEQIEEYVSGMSYIEPNTTVLPLNIGRYGYAENSREKLTSRVDPFRHASDHIGTERHVVTMANYEANMGYFPILFRDEINPYVHIGNVEIVRKGINFEDYEDKTGGRVDYVLVWLGKKRNIDTKFSLSIYNQLRNKYERIFISSNGLMEIYRLKKQQG